MQLFHKLPNLSSKESILFLLMLCLHFKAFAQKQNNVWIFGSELGINFNSASAQPIKSNILASEGCASVCDPSTGDLLFYSNGEKVWDSTHTVMPNGNGLLGPVDRSSTQGVVIAPVFGHPKKYYIFHLEEFNFYRSGYLRYSVVDMNLNGGKGDVLPGLKNMTLDTGLSEKMILAPACNGLWLLTHHIDSPIFYAYKIDNPLFVHRPVISNTGGKAANGLYYIGEMKLSPDQKNIALGNWISPVYGLSGTSPIELFDFDRVSGKVSNPKVIDSSNFAYSIEFSPDNKKFYVALFDSFLYQYDLSLLPSTSAVLASKTQIAGDNFSTLRRGPDGKLYIVRHNYFKEMSRIHFPNLPAASCSLEINAPSLAFPDSRNVYIQMGNNVLQPVMGSDTLILTKRAIELCEGDAYTYDGDARRSNFYWQDGLQNSSRVISKAGTYWVSSTMGCSRFVDTFVVSTKAKTYSFSSTKLRLCFREEYVAQAKTIASQYLWHDGSDGSSFTFLKSGKGWVQATNGNCAFQTDSFDIELIDYKVQLRDTFICSNDTLILDAAIDSSAEFLWNTGSNDASIKVNRPGTYWVNVRVGPCDLKTTISIFPKSFAVNFSRDTIICDGESIRLEVLDKNLSYLWQDGSTLPYLDVRQQGNYSVQISDGQCITNAASYVQVLSCEDCIRVPNAFTPNQDGLNDKFRVLGACLLDEYAISIYNRWGEQVFYSENLNEAWDGSTKGLPQNAGVYHYMIRLKYRKPGAEVILLKGDISLIR